MNDPNATTSPRGKIAAWLMAALLASLGAYEGRKYVPYYDSGGVLTVCEGITGPDVIKGKKYTDQECDFLISKHVAKIWYGIGGCLTRDMTGWQVFSYLHFAFNVGVGNFCSSTLAKKHNRGDAVGACKEFARWVFVKGKDCRVGRYCPGIVIRRTYEQNVCEGNVDITKIVGGVL
jgi:lysozyme